MEEAPFSTPNDNNHLADWQQHLQEAVELHRNGALGDAQQLYKRVLARQPDNYDALQLLGLLASQTNNFEAAVALIGKAISINPNHANAHFNMGYALRALGRYPEAVQSYIQSQKLNPDSADAYLQCGLAYIGMNHLVQAIACMDRAIQLCPNDALAYFNRGVALARLGHFDAAIDAYEIATTCHSDFPEAYFNWGNALQSLKRYELAVAAYDKAIAIRQNFADAFTNRGNALKSLDRHQEAIGSYAAAIECKSDNVEAWLNMGVAHYESLDIDKAVVCYDRALEINSQYEEAHWNKALALLLNGDLENGFKLHEWRWKRRTFSSKHRDFKQPLWLGDESLQGKIILLHAEQGLGDTIQFCRYCEEVQRMGATVLLEVQAPLVGLLSSLRGVSRLISQGDIVPDFDFHCPLMSLPLAFKTRLDTVPASHHYLSSESDKRAAWKLKLAAINYPKVGLAWSGSDKHKNDKNRSIELAALMEELPPHYAYVSLQKEIRQSDLVALEKYNISHFEDAIEDFSDTAALCDLMDFVISVDTSVAHLAGALGKPVHLLLPEVPDWRWMLAREETPWYPSMKIYRLDSDRKLSIIGSIFDVKN